MESSKTFTYKRSANIAIVKKNVLDCIQEEDDLKRSQFDLLKSHQIFFNHQITAQNESLLSFFI